MSIAIIAEYNPFHYGHIRQIESAKAKWPKEKIYVFLSGKYLQRGELAVASFRKRKKIAKKYGVDKVIKIPFFIATQAAHIFASGAVKMVSHYKIDKIFFGTDKYSARTLIFIAKKIIKNENEYNQFLKQFLKQGFSFPKSAALAMEKLTSYSVDKGNDILGLEYCKAIVKNNLDIKPYSIKRNIPYNLNETKGKYASASFIRAKLAKGQDVSRWTPLKITSFKKIDDLYPKFQKIVKKSSAEQLSKIHLISEGMENLFKKHIDAPSYEEFVARTTSKRYTNSRIKRAILYVLLQKTKSQNLRFFSSFNMSF